MRLKPFIMGLLIIAVSSTTAGVMSMPLHAAVNETAVQDQDMDGHDYIMDRQQSRAESMVLMSDDELSDVTGVGFSSFTLENGVARAWFNIKAETFTEIESFKMGYYDDTADGGTGFGWDQDWLDVSLGTSGPPAEDLVCSGLYIETKFSNIADPAKRTLDYIKLGTDSMTGPIIANFVSFSGHIESGGLTLVDGHRLNLTPAGYRTTIYSTNSQFYLKLENSGIEKGWWAFWNNATVTHNLVP